MPKILVVGNEKGGVGKTTCSMHLIVGLADKGYKVSSIDIDSRQQSLTTYINNRNTYNKINPENQVPVFSHWHFESNSPIGDLEAKFRGVFDEASKDSDYIVIDTPGSYGELSSLIHSYADIVITPINDSFVDLEVLAKINQKNFEILGPSIYSQMLWEQKMERLKKFQKAIDWIIVCNRFNVIDTQNQRNVIQALNQIAKRFGCQIHSGFNDRVIFRELFPYGLTLLDLKKAKFHKPFSISQIAARQEIRDLVQKIESI